MYLRMRIGTLQATGDIEENMNVYTFIEDGTHKPETWYIPDLFMPHFEALDYKKAYRIEAQDHEGILERCVLLDAQLVCSHCSETYTQLIPLETWLGGIYCSADCLESAELFEAAMSRDD